MKTNQTNHDQWNPEISDGREEFVEDSLLAVGEGKVDKDALFEIMSTRPDLNDMTVYTTMMSAGDGIFEAVVRETLPQQ